VTEGGYKFKRAIWQIFSPKLSTVETNYPLVLREPSLYAHEMISALVDIEDFIENYIPDNIEGKAAFLRRIDTIDSHYGMKISILLSRDPAALGDPRHGRDAFMDHVRQHVNALRIFARDSGLGEGGEDGEEGIATLRIREASPNIFLEPWILRRLDQKTEENVILLVIGQTGAGKSLSSISLAHDISRATGRKFDLDHVVFTIQDILRLVYHTDPPLPRGSVLIFDDAGANANARDWRSQANTILAKMAQTFRYMGIMLILTVPDMSFIDVQVRKSIHAKLISVVNESGENEKGTFKIQVNLQDEEGNIEFGPPRLMPEDFGDLPFKIATDNLTLESIHFDLPPEPLIEPYKRKKQEFLSRQIVDLESAMDMDQKLEEMRRKALYEKYSKMIEDQGEWDEISDLRKQAARAKAEAEIQKARAATKRISQQDQIDDIIVTRVKAGESERMISEVISASIRPYSSTMVHRRKTTLQEKGRL
jgi:GTPase SAR1 family protein